MENILLVSLSRQVALGRQLDVVANNVANVNTNGFKANSLVFSEYLMPGAKAQTASLSEPVSYVVDRSMMTDFSPGTIDATGNELDFAVQGDGYFAVQTDKGERYTRAGSFTLNSKGELVTPNGDKVLGDGGPLTFTTQDGKISVAADGTISTLNQGQQNTHGKLKLVTLKPADIKKEGDTLFSSTGQVEPDTKSRIVQGALEKSNVQPVREISRLIEITRSYEQLGQMIESTNRLRETAIDRLSQVS